MPRFLILALALALAAAPAAFSAARADKVIGYKNIAVQPIDLGNPSTDVLGRALSYPKGEPVMKAFKITIPPGKATILHSHEVAIFAFVLSGTLEVDYGAKGRKRFSPGAGFLEAVDWCHKGRAVGEQPAVLVALYLGAPDLKNTVSCEK